jgi:mono/diheme cytochrome c family protein
MQNRPEGVGARGNCVVAAAFRSGRVCLAAIVLFAGHAGAQTSGTPGLQLGVTRTSPMDLEVGGDLAHLPANTTRYITRENLLALPQVNFTATGDANFTGRTQISGVSLDELSRHLAGAPDSDLAVAICNDKYRANYSHAYIVAHHPVLVLEINGQPPSGWPKDAEGRGLDMGPYMISHPTFAPSFKILAQSEEPQIPWGVVRIEFRNEGDVLGAIAPRGPRAEEATVQTGYRIAQQNCFRCHNLGDEGGQKAGRPWLVLSAWASASPEHFAAYVHNPKDKNPHAEMPGFPEYDAATMRALIEYFQTFTAREKL